MQARVLSRGDVRELLRHLLLELRVVAPVEVETGTVRFEAIDDPSAVTFDYVRTLLPPKKALLPPRETLFRFKRSADGPPLFEPVFDTEPQVLFGVHPCDLAGIAMLDWAMRRPPIDAHYVARREATIIVGLDCMPDEHCFCTSLGVDLASAADLMLTPIAESFLVTVGSERGERVIDAYAVARLAEPNDLLAAERFRARKRAAFSRSIDAEVAGLPLLLMGAVGDEVWNSVAAPCLSCGSCNLVCPTCFCFDIEDEVTLDGTSGTRQRRWDGCQLEGFAETAGGHNFRSLASERLRHRIFRKYQYLMTQYGHPFCTGCGRCGAHCPVHINITDTLNAVAATNGHPLDGDPAAQAPTELAGSSASGGGDGHDH